MDTLVNMAKMMSRFKKERYLKSLSEDDFRDLFIRPLFIRRGFEDGRDFCGAMEKGKDAIFITKDLLGLMEIYAVQTKKGNINLAKKTTTNIVEITTQLKTALNSKILFVKEKEKKLPTKAVLCASGKINDSARQYIHSEVNSPAIIFMDSDDIIPLIDNYMPECWFNMNSEVTPYFRSLKRMIESDVQLFTKSELLSSDIVPVAVSEEMFVPLRLFRYVLKPKKMKHGYKYVGQIEQVPKIEEFPVTGLLSKPQKLILIIGSAGTGKTTSLLRLAYIACDRSLNDPDRIKIPIFLKAKEIDENIDIMLVDMCTKKTMEVTNSAKSSFSSNDLNEGKVIILVDALDEIPDNMRQKKIINKILDFNKYYPACQVVLTSREYTDIDKMKELRAFTEFNLSPISLKQAEKIVHNLHKKTSLPVEKSSEVLRRIQDIHGMELTPLLVTVFAATTDYSRSDIPANITELFKKFTELMLGRWDASKGMALQYHAPLKDFILQKVAYEMHRRRVTRLQISEFMSISEAELMSRGYHTDISQLNEEMIYRSGLFRIIENYVEFRHLMLQEFFAGRGIQSIDVLEALISDDWWRRAIVFYFGENPGDESAFSRMKASLMIRTPEERFSALITLGLSLQASYLVKVDSKIPTYVWLIKQLSEVEKDYEKEVISLSRYPLNDFILYYLISRDAVALNIIKNYISEIIDQLKQQNDNNLLHEYQEFWLIIGLIETGAFDEAESMVKNYSPSDLRLLLCIHISCFLIQHTRITLKSEKLQAAKICGMFENNIIELRDQLMNEFKTELLEIKHNSAGIQSGS